MALEDQVSPIGVFISAFALSSFAGLAALLRSGNEINVKGIIAATLNSGLLSLAIALIWYTQFKDNIFALVGICVLAGIGGMTAVDFVIAAVKKGGLNISFKDNNVKINDGDSK